MHSECRDFREYMGAVIEKSTGPKRKVVVVAPARPGWPRVARRTYTT